MGTRRLNIGELLLACSIIDRAQLKVAVAYQGRWGGRLGQAMVALGFVTEQQLMTALSHQLGVPYLELGERLFPRMIVGHLPQKLMRERRVMAVALLSEHTRGPLVVAMVNPQDLQLVDELAFATGKAIAPVLVTERDLDAALRRHGVVRPNAPDAEPPGPLDLPWHDERETFKVVGLAEDETFEVEIDVSDLGDEAA
jgi:hypothetical protein